MEVREQQERENEVTRTELQPAGQFDNAHKTEPPLLTEPHGTNQFVLTHRSESSVASVEIVRTPHQSDANNGGGNTSDPAPPWTKQVWRIYSKQD